MKSTIYREKIFLTVITYPQPSITYEENFCTAGFREDGSMIRIYPISFSRYRDLHKYTYIELSFKKRAKGDFRPESFTPVDIKLNDMKLLHKVTANNNWEERKKICLKNVYYDFQKLINDSRKPNNISLAVFKPKEIVDFKIEEDERDWKLSKKMYQLKLFEKNKTGIQIEKIPYKFKYIFKDEKNRTHKLQIIDWEVGVLYRKCLKRVNGDELLALEKVKQKFFNEFINRDIYFFVGTTLEWHLRNAKNPFLIIGVFYPPKIKKF